MESNKSRNDELIERLINFSEKRIDLCYKFPQNPVNTSLVTQTVKCGTSIGANYSEACAAESSKDFVHKIRITLKEAKETRYFLRLLLRANPQYKDEIVGLGQNSMEFIKIFSSILTKFRV